MMSEWDSDPVQGHNISLTLLSAWKQFRQFQSQVSQIDIFHQLPPDLQARVKVDLKHVMLNMVVGGNYVQPDIVQAILAPRDGPQPAILDIGTGTGIWAVEMAREFPHAQVVAIDLVPPKPPGPIPPNCKFEVDDVNQSLDHYANSFDLVHGRLIDAGIQNFPRFLNQVARMLRPGGMVLLVKGVHDAYSETGKTSLSVNEEDPDFAFLQKIFIGCYNAIKSRGGQEDAATDYETYFANDPNFDYQTTVVKDLFIPIGPWGVDPIDTKSIYICELLRINCLILIYAVKPLLLTDHPEEEVDRWIEGANKELRTLSLRSYSKWRYAWATRRPGPWIELDV